MEPKSWIPLDSIIALWLISLWLISVISNSLTSINKYSLINQYAFNEQQSLLSCSLNSNWTLHKSDVLSGIDLANNFNVELHLFFQCKLL